MQKNQPQTIKTSKGEVRLTPLDNGRISLQQPTSLTEYSRDEARDLAKGIEQATEQGGSSGSQGSSS